jgi:hypothetical protein
MGLALVCVTNGLLGIVTALDASAAKIAVPNATDLMLG